jgi:hypothetical protein
MTSRRILKIILGLLLVIQVSASAQSSGDWKRIATDKFGDPIGEVFYDQMVLGTGSSSTQNNELQSIHIISDGNDLVFLIKETGTFNFPLNSFLWKNEPVLLYIKDSSGKTYSFDGIQHKDSLYDAMTIEIFPDDSLTALLRRSGRYKAVIEGERERWSCSFSFNGSIPE